MSSAQSNDDDDYVSDDDDCYISDPQECIDFCAKHKIVPITKVVKASDLGEVSSSSMIHHHRHHHQRHHHHH